MNRILVVLLIILNLALCLYLFRYWKILVLNDLSRDQRTDGSDVFDANEWKPTRKDQSDTPDVFVATNEWKPLRKDQRIPKGLHVRINMQTGEREAKLLSAENEDVKKTEVTDVSVMLLHEDTEDSAEVHDKEKYAYLKEALKKLKNETSDDENTNDNQSKKKFRTYEELKKDMAELNLNIKTDAEVLDSIFNRYNVNYRDTNKWCTHEEPELLSILSDLENLLHQVDNAQEFSKQNGMDNIVVPCLSANSTKLRISAARVLGAAVQNNARAQIAALKARVIPLLLKNIALEKNYEVRHSSIFALSCLIRSFPLAEMELIEGGGLSVLLSLFDETSSKSLKLQMKVVTFFYDLVMEKDDAELTLKEDILLRNISDSATAEELKLVTEKLKQYNEVGLKSKLIDHGWCIKLSNLLLRLVSDSNIENVKTDERNVDHDSVDKVLNAMLSVAARCVEQFKTEKTYTVLINLSKYYEILSAEDEFYKSFFNITRALRTKLDSE